MEPLSKLEILEEAALNSKRKPTSSGFHGVE